MSSLLIRNAHVVQSTSELDCDVVCRDGVIASLERPRSVAPDGFDEVVDASGLLTFPGFIDPHIHSRQPGGEHKEDFAHSTRAAAAGGITTVLEMPNGQPPVDGPMVLRERIETFEPIAHVDFGLWGIAYGTETAADIAALVDAGAVAIKLFWGYALDRPTGRLIYNWSDAAGGEVIAPPDSGGVFRLMQAVHAAGSVLAVHCEDRPLLDALQHELTGRGEYADLLARRPDFTESTSVAIGIELSRATGCPFHVVHLSSARAVELIRQAQAEGVPVTTETCPHFLTLTDESYETVGPRMKVYPPVRYRSDQDALWDGLRDRSVGFVCSDHAPHTVEEKQLPLDRQPAGAVGVETTVPLLVDAMVAGRLTPGQLASVLSEEAAKRFGLWPRKGLVWPGADADLTLVDPTSTWRIDDAELHSKEAASPWHGSTGTGRATVAIVRGNVVMRDGAAVGSPTGRWVRPVAKVAS